MDLTLVVEWPSQAQALGRAAKKAAALFSADEEGLPLSVPVLLVSPLLISSFCYCTWS